MKIQSALSAFALAAFTFIAAEQSIAQQCVDGACQLQSKNGRTNSALWPATNTGYQSHPHDARNCAACANGTCEACPECDQNQQRYRGEYRGEYDSRFQMNRPARDRGIDPLARDRYPYRLSNFAAPTPQDRNFGSYNRLASSIDWQTDFNRASQVSRRTGQPMLVRVTADWCGHCQRMKQTTFDNRDVIQNVNSAFIAIDLNADQNRELVQKMGVQSLPATLVITSDNRIVAREQGYRSAEQLTGTLRRFLQRAELIRPITVAVR